MTGPRDTRRAGSDDDTGKAEVNSAARHDPPGAPEGEDEPTRPRDRQVKGRQSAELNPLDPGGIGG